VTSKSANTTRPYPQMRFIIYKQEFLNGRRTTYLREPLFASEDEATARRKQRELFNGEVYCFRNTYRHVETEQKDEILIVRAPEQNRFVGVGLMDKLRPETQLIGDDSPEPD